MKQFIFFVCVIATASATFNLCNVCTHVVSVAQQYAPQGEAVVQQQLDQTCQSLGSYSASCQQLVDQQLNNILNHIEDDSPKTFCAKLHLCTNKQNYHLKAHYMQKSKAEQGCKLCNFVVNYVRLLGDNDATIVKNGLEIACRSIPVIGQQCLEIVDNFLDQIIALIDSDLNAEQICSQIGLC